MAAERGPLLEMKAVYKRFSGIQALTDMHIRVERAEIHALVGENGAGKSTLIKILSGMYAKDAGSIIFEGREVNFRDPLESQQAGIVVIYQDFDLAPNLSVEENLLLGKEPSRWSFLRRRRLSELAAEHLRRVDLPINPKTLVGSLTVAQRQRVAIAKALSSQARLLVMDEPTSALAVDEIAYLLELIRRLKKSGTSVIYISHKLDEVFAACDSITVLRDGRYICTKRTSETSQHEIVSLMVGRKLQDYFAKSNRGGGEALLEVSRLGKKGVFSDVSFTLHRGEILGLYGLKGAGRSELARVIFGLDRRDSGEIRIAGAAVHFRSAWEAIGHKVGLIPEDRKNQSLFPNMSVKENASLVSLGDIGPRGFLDGRKERALVGGYIGRLRIRAAGMEQPILGLSGGNQQKVILARWLAIKPRILILDEPTAGIDVGAKMEIYRLMAELAAQGIGLLLISSELPEVLAMSDRILVMHEGRIVAALAAEEAGEDVIMHSIHSGKEKEQHEPTPRSCQ